MSKRIVHLHIIRCLHYFGKRLTDRLGKMYNPLNKLARGIKFMNRIVVGVTGGVGFMAAGFGLLINASDKEDSSFMLSGAGLIIVGLIFWLDALKNAGKEDKISGQSRQALIGEVKGLRKDLGNRDKRIKTRPRKGSKSNGDN